MKAGSYKPLILGTIILLAVSRLVPHPHNFTPLGGIAILGATYFNNRIWKYFIPMIAFYISDLLVSNLIYSSFYPDQTFIWFSNHMLWNYGAILVIVALSSWIMKRKSWKNLIGASLSGAVIFFLISNFGSWAGNPLYSNDIVGLISCYAAGLPFFPNTLASTLLFAGVGYAVIEYGQIFLYQISLKQ